MRRALDELELLALQQAASGCIGGLLRDWPVLAKALCDAGFPNLALNEHTETASGIAKLVIENLRLRELLVEVRGSATSYEAIGYREVQIADALWDELGVLP